MNVQSERPYISFHTVKSLIYANYITIRNKDTKKGCKKIKGKKGVCPSTVLQQETFKGEQTAIIYPTIVSQTIP